MLKFLTMDAIPTCLTVNLNNEVTAGSTLRWSYNATCHLQILHEPRGIHGGDGAK